MVMNSSLRQKKVSSLIKQELSRILLDFSQEDTGLVSITSVDMTRDLKTAHVYFSFYHVNNRDLLLKNLEQSKKYLRKMIASKIDLKYNPQLIFSEDLKPLYEERMNSIMMDIQNEANRAETAADINTTNGIIPDDE